MTRYGCGHIDCILVVMTYKKSARITGMRAQKTGPVIGKGGPGYCREGDRLLAISQWRCGGGTPPTWD